MALVVLPIVAACASSPSTDTRFDGQCYFAQTDFGLFGNVDEPGTDEGSWLLLGPELGNTGVFVQRESEEVFVIQAELRPTRGDSIRVSRADVFTSNEFVLQQIDSILVGRASYSTDEIVGLVDGVLRTRRYEWHLRVESSRCPTWVVRAVRRRDFA